MVHGGASQRTDAGADDLAVVEGGEVGGALGLVAGQRHLLHGFLRAQDALAQGEGELGGHPLDPNGHGPSSTEIPQVARHGARGSSRIRSRPDRKASGGQVIGSTAIDRRRRSGGLTVSPVNTIR